MQDLARAKGFRVRQLLDSAATSTAVIDAIESAAHQLNSGGLFLTIPGTAVNCQPSKRTKSVRPGYMTGN
jgi:hypothetical protein